MYDKYQEILDSYPEPGDDIFNRIYMITNNTSTNTSLENTLDSLKLTIQGRKRWVMLVLSFLSSEADSFILWKRNGLRKFYMFGRSLSQPEAQSIINTILNRFPQYQFHNQ